MKKILPILIIALTISLTGCLGAIKKQGKIEDQMKNLVINSSASKVYTAAEKYMNSMFIKIKPTGKNTGASSWSINDVTLGSNKYKEKVRFTVRVASKGNNKSKLNISRERSTNMMGDFSKPVAGRYLTYEYNVLKKMNPARAAQIDKNASN